MTVRRGVALTSAALRRILPSLVLAALLAWAGPSPGRCNIRALRIRPGGTLTTAAVPDLPVNGDMTLRLLIKRNPWDLVSHEILSLLDANGTHRLLFGMNTSPWIWAYVSDNGLMAGAHHYGDLGAVYHGCPSGTAYEDWWLVYKAPTTDADGYFRVFRDGGLAYYYSDAVYFDLPIPAGTDMTWKGGPLMLRLGDPIETTMADYQVLDIAWWTAAFSADDIAGVKSAQIAGLTPTTAHAADLYWYARPSNTYGDRISPEMGAAVGNAALDAVFSGAVGYTSDTPRVAGWELPDKIDPPDPGPAPLAAAATTDSITVTGQPGSPDTTARTLGVSEGMLWPYSGVAQEQFGPDGVAESSVTGLKPGTTYYVTGQWEDADGNVATRQVQATTAGVRPPTQGPTKSMHITGSAEAVTCDDAWSESGGLFRMPYESDTTLRLLVRRAPGMVGPCRFISQRAGSAGVFGYPRFVLEYASDEHLIAGVCDGQQWFKADSGRQISTTSYDELWLVYKEPTAAQDGSIDLYFGAELAAGTAIPAGTDMSWKKWDAQFVLGGVMDGMRNPTIDYHMLEPAWWTTALTAEERAAISGKPLYSLSDEARQTGHLYWYARPHAAAGKVEPDLGASIGTALERVTGTLTYATGNIAPLFATNVGGTFTYEDDVPPHLGGSPYTMADVIAAAQAAAGLIDAQPAFPRLNADDAGDSTGLVDMSDTVRIARVVAGLEHGPGAEPMD